VGRDAWLDNVKMTLVTVVVIGHSLPLLHADGVNARIYDFIYLWHIPAFVVVTGYLSRSFAWTPRHLWALFCTIVVPYFVFETAMLAFRLELGGPGNPRHWPDDAYVNPHWPMWYLAAVFVWRLATPLLKRHWVALPASLAASLVFPVLGSEVLDLNRVIGLLPFFVLGLHLRPRWLESLKTPLAGVAGAGALLLLFLVAGHTDEWIRTRWLWYTFDYDYFGADLATGAWNRIRLIALALLGTTGVLAMVPRRRSWFTDLGAATMVVYLFHGFFIKVAVLWLAENHRDWTTTYADRTLWGLLAGAIAVALFLAWPPVSRRLAWFIDPIGSAQRARTPGRGRATLDYERPGRAGAGRTSRVRTLMYSPPGRALDSAGKCPTAPGAERSRGRRVRTQVWYDPKSKSSSATAWPPEVPKS